MSRKTFAKVFAPLFLHSRPPAPDKNQRANKQ